MSLPEAFRAICAIADPERPELLVPLPAAAAAANRFDADPPFVSESRRFCSLVRLCVFAMAARPALPRPDRDDEPIGAPFRSLADLRSWGPISCNSALPAAAARLFGPRPASAAAAMAAPVPCLYESGGFSHGGLGGEASASSLAAAFSAAAAAIAPAALALPPGPPPDDLTRFVWATRSKNRRSNLYTLREWAV